MKAKVIKTGEIVEVYEHYDDYSGETLFKPIVSYYEPDELDFDVPQDTPEEVTKWEYKIAKLDLMSIQNDFNLVQLGNEGWQMCAAIPFLEAMKVHFYFKRPKE